MTITGRISVAIALVTLPAVARGQTALAAENKTITITIDRESQLVGCGLNLIVVANGRYLGKAAPGQGSSFNVPLRSDAPTTLQVISGCVGWDDYTVLLVPTADSVNIKASIDAGWTTAAIRGTIVSGAREVAASEAEKPTVLTVNLDRRFKREISRETLRLILGEQRFVGQSRQFERGIILSRAIGVNAQVTGEINFGVGAIKTQIGAHLTDTLGDNIRQSASREHTVLIDGDKWSEVTVVWTETVRSGTAKLQAYGSVHEIPFEYVENVQAQLIGNVARSSAERQPVSPPSRHPR